MTTTIKHGLTPLQKRVLEYLKAYVEQHGYSPSYRELQDAMGFGSVSSAHRVIELLEGRGYVVRLRGLARSIRLAE